MTDGDALNPDEESGEMTVMEENAIDAQRLQEDIMRTLVKRVLPALSEQLVVKNEVC